MGVWLARMVAIDPRHRYADAAAALEDTGDACTITGEDLGELSLGDGVAIRMNSISWGLVRTAH